ncbi:MAG: hypothetical protein ACOC1X_03170 [Promethearchaeota archaeon]
MSFNYYDEITKGGTKDWISYLNYHYIEVSSPEVYVFKLDKEKTDIDELYGGEEFGGARIYIPPFVMRAFYLDNEWTQQLGTDTFPYLEIQEDIVFAVNFDNMVNTIRDKKMARKSEVFIEYTKDKEVTAEKRSSTLILKVNDETEKEFDLESSECRTVKKLVSEINNLDGFKSYYEGENDISSNIVTFKETRFQNKKLNMFSEDDTYKNMTDVIEKGDLILTEKYFLYEVQSNLPAGDIGWDYSIMLLTANTRSLDKAELPNNWNELIREREYGLRDKTQMEGQM